jgi:hypothetical protein
LPRRRLHGVIRREIVLRENVVNSAATRATKGFAVVPYRIAHRYGLPAVVACFHNKLNYLGQSSGAGYGYTMINVRFGSNPKKN